MKQLLIWGLIAVILLLIGSVIYTTTLISCDQLIVREARIINFNALTPESANTWIVQTFPFFKRLWKEQGKRDNELQWSWASFNHRFALTLSNRHKNFWQDWRFKSIQIDHMIRCLGKPDNYVGIYTEGPDGLLFYLSFVYQKQGYIFTTGWFENKELSSPMPVNGKMELLSVQIVPPGNAVTLAESAYDQYQSIDARALLSSAIKPWPQRITDIAVPEDFVNMTMR